MPPVTRYFLKSGFVFFVMYLLSEFVRVTPFISFLLPPSTSLHILTVGWITQIIMGVAIWMFPRNKKIPDTITRKMEWATYGCINSGLLIRIVTEPNPGWYDAGLLTLSALLQWAGGMLFILFMWNRVRGKSYATY